MKPLLARVSLRIARALINTGARLIVLALRLDKQGLQTVDVVVIAPPPPDGEKPIIWN